MAADAHDIPELDRAGLRKFAWQTGAIVAVLFGVALPWLIGLDWPRWPWIFGLALTAWGLVAPSSLRPVYRLWMHFGLLMNRIVSPIVLGTIFFVLITPIALFMKARRRDAMNRHLDDSAQTYRIPSRRRPREQVERPF